MAWCLASGLIAHAQTSVTIRPEQQRSIGGISQLDRERFFTHTETVLPPNNTNLGNLNTLIGSPNGPNVTSGRISTEFDQLIAQDLPEDPSRPGFIEPNALRNKIRTSHRNFVLNSNRYTGIRNNPNAFIVNSGRRDAFFPGYFNIPNSGGVPRADAYAEFLNIFLEEAVLGPNAYVPVSPDRYAVELLNEPDFNFNANFTRQDLSDWHRDVIQSIKAVHPDAIVGGPSLGATNFEGNEFGGDPDYSRFDERLGRLIADRANSGIDYYSFHPYERYDVRFNNTLDRAVDQSPGRVNGLLDLTRARDLIENPGQDPLPIAISEYGSFNRLDGDPDLAGYTRDEMQWDLARDIREQLLIYLNRPDAILNATPFVQGKHFSNLTPTPVNADNVFYEQDANGAYSETIVAKTFRTYANVSGEYIGIANSNTEDIQSIAFRDGNEVYVLLNNLLDTNQSIDLSVLGSLGTVQSATIDRVYRENDQNVFLDDVDITSAFESLTLRGDEGAVLTLTLSDAAFTQTFEEQTFYADTTVAAFDDFGRTPVMSVAADIDPATAESALLRISYERPDSFDVDGREVKVILNGTDFTYTNEEVGIDDGDFGIRSREIEIPTDLLLDGDNTLQVDFFGAGGFLGAAALVVTSDTTVYAPGDYNRDGLVDIEDYDLWASEYGSAVIVGAASDGNGDGLIDAVDYTVWRDALAAGSTGTTVPESGALALLSVVCGLALCRRRSL